MATRHRYPADRGLTAHMLLTMFLLGLLYAVVIAALVLANLIATIVRFGLYRGWVFRGQPRPRERSSQ